MLFEEFVAEHGQALLRLAGVLTGDRHRAEDLTQTALADAYRHWRRVSAASDPVAYVRRMLVNAQLSWRRRRWTDERPVGVQADVRVTDDPADAVDARDEMRVRLSRLAPRARTVLVLRYYADLDDQGIADVMGVSASSVRATASRALAALREATEFDVTREAR